MRVLHVTPTFWPATFWGGPIYSVYGLCNALAAIPGIELRVLTTDAAGLRRSQCVEVSGFPVRYPAGYEVYFTRRLAGQEVAPGLLLRVWSMVRWADVVHLTAAYSFSTLPTLFVCRLLGKPVVWSPRGGLQATQEWQGARRRMLKGLWESVCNTFIGKGCCVLHVTSEMEKTSSLARIPKASAAVVSNGVEIPNDLPPRNWSPEGRLRLLFLGRLDPKKGIENLFSALAHLADKSIGLAICGTGHPRYVEKLKEVAHALGLDDQVIFRGQVDGVSKTQAFLDADVCVVPSHSENFCMVVAEALAHGVPVIASKGTPWEGVEKNQCGLWVENSEESLARALVDIRRKNLTEMGNNGRTWMRRSFQWGTIADEMCDLYQSVAGEGT
jgi:glycosyltransferase involved in cell wall biosynthesis